MCLSEKRNGKRPQRETEKISGGLPRWLHYMADVWGYLHDLRSDVDIYNIQNRGCSEPFLEVGAAEFHNEDYVFSNEISLKFPNHQTFSMCRQISPSKKWHELD